MNRIEDMNAQIAKFADEKRALIDEKLWPIEFEVSLLEGCTYEAKLKFIVYKDGNHLLLEIDDKPVCHGDRFNPFRGLPLGLNDAEGNPVHFGDILSFDEEEWGGECEFEVVFEKGETSVCGTVSDISEFCTIIKKWYENV